MKVDTIERIGNGWLLLISICFIVNGFVHLLGTQFPFPLWDESTDILTFVGAIFILGIIVRQPKLAKTLWDERYRDKGTRAAAAAYFVLLMLFSVFFIFFHQDNLLHREQVFGIFSLTLGGQFFYIAVSEFMGR